MFGRLSSSKGELGSVHNFESIKTTKTPVRLHKLPKVLRMQEHYKWALLVKIMKLQNTEIFNFLNSCPKFIYYESIYRSQLTWLHRK
jgi:hypothetical protein